MFLYFPSMICVLTCEDYPQLLPIEEMRAKNLYDLCNQWTKEEAGPGEFRLVCPYTLDLCACDFHERYKNTRRSAGIRRCEECHKSYDPVFEEGTRLYLQNSGAQDQVWAHPRKASDCVLTQVPDHPDVYQWVNVDDRARCLFVLNVHDGYLSDKNIYKYGTREVNERVLPFCRLLFIEDLS